MLNSRPVDRAFPRTLESIVNGIVATVRHQVADANLLVGLPPRQEREIFVSRDYTAGQWESEESRAAQIGEMVTHLSLSTVREGANV